jgi:putative PIN family toxin of toxin-antitoxin system
MTVDRLVLDTNALISAILSSKEAPAILLDELRRTGTVLIFSEPTMAELGSRLMRDKFDPWVHRETRLRFLAEIDAVAEIVGIAEAPMGCRDRSDDKFLETALASDCQLIVSGDKDLLEMHPWQNIQILSPTQALKVISPFPHPPSA